MGFGQQIIGTIKGTYYFLEDKWYNVLDRIDTKLHVYKIIDPIDKVIPSFILFLLFLLFTLVLTGYLIQFSSPYDVTFTTLDAKTSEKLAGVQLLGIIDTTEFEEKTDSLGTAIVQIEGSKNNLFEIFSMLLFQKDPSFSAIISANKEGYEGLEKKSIELNSKQYELLLNQKKIEFVAQYPDSTKVVLTDAENSYPISVSEDAYIKFNCDNKNIVAKTVKDSDDGALDGLFLLNETQCQFTVIEAAANGYETSRTKLILPSNITQHEIALTKTFVPTTGKAKIYVIEENSSPKNYLSGISVNLISESGTNTEKLTLLNGLADFELTPGKYKVTAFSSDSSYYALTEDSNITIEVSLSQTSEKEILLKKLDPSNSRFVRVRVLDSNGQVPIAGVGVTLYSFNTDANGYSIANESNLGVCINNYSTKVNCTTDANGLINIGGGLTKELEGRLILKLNKEGYLIRLIKPVLYKAGEGPENVLIAKADSTNSGIIKVKVKTKTNSVPIFGAETNIYYNSPDLLVNKIKMNNESVLTNYLGEASYNYLVTGTYAAKAEFEGAHSGVSSTKDLDANKTIIFDLNIDTAGSFLEIDLLDASTCNEGLCSRIANPSIATVKVAKFSDGAFAQKISESTISYVSSKQLFVSSAYTKNSRLIVTIDANNYAPAMISIDGMQTPLVSGANNYKVKIYPLSLIDNNKPISDSNVSIFFDDIYNSLNEATFGTSSVQILLPGNDYYAKFSVIIPNNIEYSSLLSLVRVNSVAGITNFLPYLENFSSSNSTPFNTSCLDESSGIHDNNYYFPDSNKCGPISLVDLQTGGLWANSILPKGTYSFVSKIKLDSSANDSQKLIFNYRAKEINSATSSETLLKTQEFDINQPLRKGVLIKIKVNDKEYELLLDNNTLTQNSFKFNASDAPNKVSVLLPLRENNITASIYNNTDNSFAASKINVFSYADLVSEFNPLTSSGSGKIHFDSNTPLISSPLKVTIKDSFTMNPRARYSAQTKLLPEKYNLVNYIVVVLELNGKTFSTFIDTKSKGKELTIDAEFVAGVLNQSFDGAVYSQDDRLASLNTKVNSIKVMKNCGTTGRGIVQNNVLSPATPIVTGNNFSTTILGVYQSTDCVEVSVGAIDPEMSYDDTNKTFYASIESLDPALACVDIREVKTGLTSINLNWNATTQLIVKNSNCPSPVLVRIDTGLVCTLTENNTPCASPGTFTLNVGEEKTLTLKGTNLEYNPAAPNPNFTDVLGYFPVYVKAKYAVETNKKLVVADKVEIHVSNPQECFAISKDIFDLTISNNSAFTIDSACQYTLIGDYFIPSTSINSFGYDINFVGKNLAPVEAFSPKLIVLGKSLETSEKIVDVIGSASPVSVTPSLTNSTELDGNLRYYENLRFDFSKVKGDFSKLMFRWFDKDNKYYDLNTPAGAKIDGAIKITLQDNSIVTITPQRNFELAPRPTCTGSGISCEVAIDPNMIFDEKMQFGLTYVLVNKLKIKYIDVNIIGNSDNKNLIVEFWPTIVTYQETITEYKDATSETQKEILLGNYQIPPLEGIIFILEKFTNNSVFSNPIFLTTTNPGVYVNSNNPKVIVWVEGSYIKASYIGNNLEAFDNKTLNYSIARTYGKGNSLGIITVVDYVDPILAGNLNKKISGGEE